MPNFYAFDPAIYGIRQINLIGQVVEVANYADACTHLYCGDANNATAEAFYKTSDALGTVRNTAGAYIVFPDTRGLGLKHIGDATVNARVKAGPAELGEVQEDQMQRITGEAQGVGIYSTAVSFADAGALNLDDSGAYAGTSGSTNTNRILKFNSADSPDARVSATTEGPTRDTSMGAKYSVTY
jgi:hypothetical protein